jgi:hypothetical protein
MSANLIKLDKVVADRIVELAGNVRKAGIELAKYAAELRAQYIDAKGNYDKKFQDFWEKFELDKNFGQRANFTRYALAGRAIEKIEANFPQLETLEKRLPTSIAALYELSQLNLDEIKICLENTYKRKDLTTPQNDWSRPKKPTPLITPSVTAAQLKSWREKWRNPTAASTDSRKLLLAVVRLDKSLNEYNKETGEYSGKFERDDVAAITEALKQTISEFKTELVRLDLHDQKLIADANKRQASALTAAQKLKAKIAAETEKAKKARLKAKKSTAAKKKK